jgi:hypothetical protein
MFTFLRVVEEDRAIDKQESEYWADDTAKVSTP